MNTSRPFDETDPKSIEAYAKKLIGRTFLNVLAPYAEFVEDSERTYSNKARKGRLGNLLEEKYFGIKANNISKPDFEKAGVELKVSAYEKNKKGELRAGERLVLGMISYENPVDMDFYQSHIWEKCKLILLIYYWRNKELPDDLYYRIDYAKLFTPPPEDLEIIVNDYKIITEKIQSGRAHELSEGDTMYLGACTKGSTAEKSLVPQYYNSEVLAKKRAFCYKVSYMTAVLNNYLASDKDTYESIVKNPEELKDKTFQQLIEERIGQYVGRSDKELCDLFERPYDNNKAQWIELAYRMLGIRSSKAEEFAKANIIVKAIRLEENGTMRESSSLPNINFKEFVQEKWENSELFRYFDETKFFFVVYKKSGDVYRLQGSQLWNMPYEDLNETVYRGWMAIQKVVIDGVKFEVEKRKNGIRINNNLPKKGDNPIIHIRPHSPKAYHQFLDGTVIGDNIKNGDQLPDGRWMTKQSFWLNNNYILSQLKESLK